MLQQQFTVSNFLYWQTYYTINSKILSCKAKQKVMRTTIATNKLGSNQSSNFIFW